jgi:hypothetical protein
LQKWGAAKAKKQDSVSQVQKGCPTMGLMIVFQKIIPVSEDLMKQKALKLYEHIKTERRFSNETENHTFLASNGWFDRLKKRYF